MIYFTYTAVDGFKKRKMFKLLRGARKYAQEMIGKHPEYGHGPFGRYAISDDGVGKISEIVGDHGDKRLRLEDLFEVRT